MRRLVIPVLAVATLVLAGLAAPQPAAAGTRWFAGADFSVGGVYFSLGFFDGLAPGRAPHHYYRTARPLSYPGLHCTSACYVADGYYYHDRSCPVVRSYFSHYHYDPYPAWGFADRPGVVVFGAPYRYAPAPRYYRPWRRDVRFDRRYDRRFDRRDDRWDRRHDRRDDRRDDRWDRRRDQRDDRDRHGNGRSNRRRPRDDDHD
jgi:hypothetical protein